MSAQEMGLQEAFRLFVLKQADQGDPRYDEAFTVVFRFLEKVKLKQVAPQDMDQIRMQLLEEFVRQSGAGHQPPESDAAARNVILFYVQRRKTSFFRARKMREQKEAQAGKEAEGPKGPEPADEVSFLVQGLSPDESSSAIEDCFRTLRESIVPRAPGSAQARGLERQLAVLDELVRLWRGEATFEGLVEAEPDSSGIGEDPGRERTIRNRITARQAKLRKNLLLQIRDDQEAGRLTGEEAEVLRRCLDLLRHRKPANRKAGPSSG